MQRKKLSGHSEKTSAKMEEVIIKKSRGYDSSSKNVAISVPEGEKATARIDRAVVPRLKVPERPSG